MTNIRYDYWSPISSHKCSSISAEKRSHQSHRRPWQHGRNLPQQELSRRPTLVSCRQRLDLYVLDQHLVLKGQLWSSLGFISRQYVSHHIKGINKRRNLARGVWRDTGISNHMDHRETWHENSRLVGLEINSFESLFQELSIYQLSYVTGVRTNPVMVRYVLLHVIISLRYILSNTCLCVQLSGEIMGSKLEVVSPIWVEDWG